MAALVRFLDGWVTLNHRLAPWLARAGGAMVLASALLITLDVVLRAGLRVTIGGADELAGYAFAIATTWGLAFVLMDRGHVRVDALYALLPRRLQAWLDVLSLTAMTVILALFAHRATGVLLDSLTFGARANTPLGTPQWLPQSLWLAGFAATLSAVLPLLGRCLLAAMQGDLQTVRTLAGARTLEEDAAAESGHVRATPATAPSPLP